MKRTPGFGLATRPGVRFAWRAACVVLALILVADTSLAGPERGAPPAPVDAAVWDAVVGGPTLFLVRLHDVEGWEKVAGPARPRGRAAITGALLTAGRTRLAVLDAILANLSRSGNVLSVTRFPASGVVAVRGDAVAVAALAALPDVAEVRPDAWRQLATPRRPVSALTSAQGTAPDLANTPAPDPANPPEPVPVVQAALPGAAGRANTIPGAHVIATRADEVWRRLGVTGEHAVVAVIDTGADWTHPHLVRAYRGRDGAHDYAWWDATGAGADRPVDVHGHGTLVTGLVVGDDGATTTGLAPGAEWIAVRAFDRTGTARDSWLLAAAEWVLAPTDRHGANPRPDLAPDIVNASWVLENGADPLYRPVVAAWRSAGILPVFAAGNDQRDLGPVGSILAPASYPEAVGVGGVGPGGAAWPLSLGGPSFYGGVAPDLMAPVAVTGPASGGGMGTLVGTSAAAPQVSGAAALMLAANPSLTADDLEALLGRSARDVGEAGPDDRFGHGILDAFEAVRLALDSGRLAGTVTLPDGAAASGRLLLIPDGAAPIAIPVRSGTFDAAVPSGDWRVALEAGLHETAPREVRIEPDITTRLDLVATEAATWDLAGLARDERGDPLTGALVSAFATRRCTHAAGCVGDPDVQTQVNAAGRFVLALPQGDFQLSASAPGRRTGYALASIPVSATAPADFVLPPAPTIAVVDADSDLEERISPYLVAALRTAGYASDPWTLPPTLNREWAPFDYDMVVWAHSASSPGRLDQRLGGRAATDALRAYLQDGGRLLVSGQNVATLDAAGASPVPAAPEFVRDVLRVQFIAPHAPGRALAGVGYFAGVGLTLDAPMGYRWGRLLSPDVVSPSSEPGDPVQTLFRYGDGSGAATGSSGESGRRMFLAFGPEGAGPPAERSALFGRAAEWLSAPDVQVSVTPPRAAPGSNVRIEVQVLGAFAASSASVEVSPPAGLAPTGRYEGLEPDPAGPGAGWAGMVPAGETVVLALEARVGSGFSGAVEQDVTARLRAEGAVRQAVAGFRPLSPGFENTRLRITPDRLHEGETTDLALVLWNSSGVEAVTRAVVPLPASLVGEPMSVASTDGSARLVDSVLTWDGVLGERAVTVTLRMRADGGPGAPSLRATVSGGGVDHVTAPAIVLLGGPVLVAGLTLSTAEAEPGDVVTATLRVENQGASPAQARARLALAERVVSLGALDWTGQVGIGEVVDVPFSLRVGSSGPTGTVPITATLSDGLAPPADTEAIASLRVRGPDLRGSGMDLAADTLVSGSTLSGSLTLRNAGDAQAPVVARLALPPTLSLEAGSAGVTAGVATEEPSGIRWEAQLAAGATETLTYQALVARSVRPNSLLAATAVVESATDPAADSLRLATTILANSLDLAASSLVAHPPRRAAGGRVAFTMTVHPSGDVEARDVVLAVRIPPVLTVDPSSLRGGVELGPSVGTLTWRGRLPVGLPHRFHWVATLDARLDPGARAITRAVVEAAGVDDLDFAAVVRVTSGDFTGSSKTMSPSVAATGRHVRVVLRVVNSGADPALATIVDALPSGLKYVPGSVEASYGVAEWDESSRSLRWRDTVAPGTAAEVRFTARMESTEQVTNVMQLTDDDGTRLASWAQVAPRRAVVLLPTLSRP